MKIKNVIFDLDGTLLDTSIGILESVRHTIGVLEMQEPSEEVLRSFIGPPLRVSFTEKCGCSQEQAEEAVKIFRKHYQNGAVLHAEQYRGIAELCTELQRRGIKMGVATNKPDRFAAALIRHFDLDTYCRSVFGADEIGSLTKTELIRLCMKDMDAYGSDTVLIGDTDNDAAGAERAGVRFLAVTYGFGFRPGETIPDYPCIGIADTPLQIADILSECN